MPAAEEQNPIIVGIVDHAAVVGDRPGCRLACGFLPLKGSQIEGSVVSQVRQSGIRLERTGSVCTLVAPRRRGNDQEQR